MSCMECEHFDVKGANDKGRHYGMCRAWGFSINENDDRTCKKKQRRMAEEKATAAQLDGQLRIEDMGV